METKLAITTLLIYIMSFFVPACDSLLGYECFMLGLSLWSNVIDLSGFLDVSPSEFFVALCQMWWTLANVTMVAIPVLLLTWLRDRTVPTFIKILQVLAVVSSTATIFMLGVEVLTFGYYVWTFSMWLLLIPVFKKRTLKSRN